MATEVTSIGVGMDTSGVEQGIKSLKTLAQQGPSVERALTDVEKSAAKTSKTLKTLGDGAGKGLEAVGKSAPKTSQDLGRVAKSADDAKKSIAGIQQSAASLGAVSTTAVRAAAGLAQIQGPSKAAAQEMARLSTGARQSKDSLADMQWAVDSATKNIRQMAAEMARALPSMQAVAKAQEQSAKSAMDMARALDGASAKTKGYESGVRSLSNANEGMASTAALAVRGVQAFLGLQVVGWAKDSAAAMFQASAAAERLRIGLDFASTRGSAVEISYLRKTTDELGLAFESTAKSYMQFQAAAKGTSLEGEKARAVFEAVGKASAVMGLSAEQNTGVLLALQQMVSKGTVQAEELRGQLGERLPGAFQIAARAMGVTTAELGKMLEMGHVISEDFLPKFAKELESSLGGAAENAANRLDAAVNRFDNAWERMKQKAGDSGVSKAIAGELTAVTRDMEAITETVERASNGGAGALSALGQGALVAAGRAGFSTLNLAANTLNGTINLLTGDLFDLRTDLAVLPDALKTNAQQMGALAVASKEADDKLSHLQSLGAQFGNEVWFKNEVSRAQEVARGYRQALAEKKALMGVEVGSYTEGMGNSQVIVRQRAETEAAEKSLAEIRQRASGVTKQYQQDLTALHKALQLGVIDQKTYVAEVSELAKRTWESSAAGKDAAKTMREREKGTQGAAAGYESLLKSVNEHIATLKLEASQQGRVTDSQKAQIKLDEMLATSKKGVSASELAALEAKIAYLGALEQERKAIALTVASYQEYLALQDELAADYVKQSKARESMRLSISASNVALDDQEKRLQIEEAMIGRTSVARDIALAQLEAEIELRKELEAIDANLDVDEATRIEARAAARGRAMRKIALAERKAYVEESDRTYQIVGDTLRDYIMGGGKDAAEYLKRLFSSLVLEPIVNYGAQGFMGMLGMGGGSGGVGGAGGGLSNLFGLASNAQTAYGLYNGSFVTGLQNIASQYFGIGGAAHSMYGLTAAQAATIPTGSMGAGVASGASAGMSAMAAGGIFTAVALAVANALGVFQEDKQVGGGLQGTLGKGGITPYALWRESGTMFSGPEYSLMNPAEAIAAAEAKLEKLRENGQGESDTAHYIQVEINNLKELYADIIDSTKAQSTALQATYDAMRTNVGDMADVLGISSDAVRDFTMALGSDVLHNDTGGLGLRFDGLSGEEITAKIQEALATANNELAQQVIGSWVDYSNTITTSRRVNYGGEGENAQWGYETDTTTESGRRYVESEFARDGEKAIDTLTRLATSLSTVNTIWDTLGYTMLEASLAGGDVASLIADAFGGLENMSAATGSYFQNFYSAEEQRATLSRQLAEKLAKEGFDMPDIDASNAREQYRALAEAQDLSTEEGRKAYAMLIGLSGVFADLTNAGEDAAKAARDQAEATRKSAIDSAYDLFQRAADQRRDELGSQADMLLDTIAGISSAVDMLRSNARDLYGTVDDTAQMLAAQGMVYVEDALAGVRAGGSVTDYDRLSESISAARGGIDNGVYTSQFERDRDALVLAGMLSEMGDLGDLQLSVEERQLKAINAQLDALEAMVRRADALVNGTEALTETVETYFDRLMAFLMPEQMETKPEVLPGGGYGGVQGSGSASTGDGSNAAVGRGGMEGVGISFEINKYVKENFGTGSNEEVAAIASWGKGKGYTTEDFAASLGFPLKDMEDYFAARGIPAFAVGTNYVPRNMLAQIHEGEAIVPKAFNPWAGGNGMNVGNEAVVAELRALREDKRVQAGEIVRLTNQVAKLLKQWDGGGMPQERREAAV